LVKLGVLRLMLWRWRRRPLVGQKELTTARTNTGVLRSAQNDDVKQNKINSKTYRRQFLAGREKNRQQQVQMRGFFAALRMTTSDKTAS
jgi:hypothetical protein